jgi:hypothetical protein
MKRFRDLPYLIGENGEIFSERNNRFLKPYNSGRYLEIQLGLLHRSTVHRLVAEVYVDNPNNYPCVNHIDGNRLNNNYLNLEWCTYSHNTKHAFSNNLIQVVKGEKNHFAKVTESDVREMRRLYDTGNYGITELGKMYGLKPPATHSIVKRNTWKHIE